MASLVPIILDNTYQKINTNDKSFTATVTVATGARKISLAYSATPTTGIITQLVETNKQIKSGENVAVYAKGAGITLIVDELGV